MYTFLFTLLLSVDLCLFFCLILGLQRSMDFGVLLDGIGIMEDLGVEGQDAKIPLRTTEGHNV